MSEAFNLAILVGSLRKESISRRLAQALLAVGPASLQCTVVEIGDLPLYNEDLESEPPTSWSRFRAQLQQADAVLFVTPEYNRSFPGCLKNALDVGSRPPGKNVFAGLAAGVVSATPYKLGAFGANHALRQALVYLDMPVLQQPEAYVAGAGELFDDRGGFATQDSQTFFANFMNALSDWIATSSRNASARSFEAFMKRRAEAAEAYVSGNAKPLDAIVAREDPTTFFSPRGDSVQGASAVADRYRNDAGAFAEGGSNRLEILQSAVSGHIAWWTGYQVAQARMQGKAEPVPMKLRVTEAFRFHQDAGWKLVHRHAEMVKPSEH